MLTAAPQQYWDELYSDRCLDYDENDVPFKKEFDTYLKSGGSCFEVGCFPGTFLIYLGRRFGYTVSGIDATPHIRTTMEAFLRTNGVQVGSLIHGDFFTTRINGQFDVVCSFGFIEHFKDTRAVLERHAELVAPGGSLVISCPNFCGVQWLLHRWLDAKNLSRHYTPSMNLKLWESILGEFGFETLHSAYYRTFDFWTEDPIRNSVNRFAKRAIVRVGRGIDRRIAISSRWFSPHLLLIAQKLS